MLVDVITNSVCYARDRSSVTFYFSVLGLTKYNSVHHCRLLIRVVLQQAPCLQYLMQFDKQVFDRFWLMDLLIFLPEVAGEISSISFSSLKNTFLNQISKSKTKSADSLVLQYFEWLHAKPVWSQVCLCNWFLWHVLSLTKSAITALVTITDGNIYRRLILHGKVTWLKLLHRFG